jgi:hypothetical protein
MSGAMLDAPDQPATLAPVPPIRFLEDPEEPSGAVDPGLVIMTCANCGAAMDERKCKLICRCGYFLSCSDYY